MILSGNGRHRSGERMRLALGTGDRKSHQTHSSSAYKTKDTIIEDLFV